MAGAAPIASGMAVTRMCGRIARKDAAKRRAGQALADMPPQLKSLPRSDILLRRRNVVGLSALLDSFSTEESLPVDIPEIRVPDGFTNLRELVDELAQVAGDSSWSWEKEA